jgi:hypothetical protein
MRPECTFMHPGPMNSNSERRLDDVDFRWQVRRNFEADFLFANGRLGPDLHDGYPSKDD